VVLALGAFFYIKGTPRYSLYKLKKAISNKDAEDALRYIDIDSIVDNMAKDLYLNEPMPSNKWEAMGRSIGQGMVMLMLPAVKETMKSQIKTSIVSSDDKSKLAGLKANLRDLNIETSGKTAMVAPKDDHSVKFKMAKVNDGYWRIVEIIDVAKEDLRLSQVTKAQIDLLGQALDQVRLDTGHYPSTSTGLNALLVNPGLHGWDGPYLKKAVPKDPWGSAFIYKCPGGHGEYDLYSLGEDGAPGGEGKNKDITSWD
jgi:type II secretion system protein G